LAVKTNSFTIEIEARLLEDCGLEFNLAFLLIHGMRRSAKFATSGIAIHGNNTLFQSHVWSFDTLNLLQAS